MGSTFVRGGETLRQRLLVRPGAGDFGPIPTAEDVERSLDGAGFAASAFQRRGPMLYFDAVRVAAARTSADTGEPS